MTTLYKYVTGGREVTFVDDADAYDAETIRKHWQSNFPELGNCQAETKEAKKGEQLTETVEGVERLVDRTVTFVKKVGTKGGPDDNQIEDFAARLSVADQVRAWEVANEEALGDVGLEGAEARRFIEAVRACDTEEDRARLRGEIDAVVAKDVRRSVEGIIRQAVSPNATRADRQLFYDAFALISDPARQRLIDAAPRMLAELQAQRDLLKTILEVAVFYSGGREVVVRMLARLEAVIREASGGN